jgi:hypothetical protein
VLKYIRVVGAAVGAEGFVCIQPWLNTDRLCAQTEFGAGFSPSARTDGLYLAEPRSIVTIMTGIGGENDAEPMIQEQQQLAKQAFSKSFVVATLVNVLSWLLSIVDTLVSLSMIVVSCFHSKTFCLKMAGKGYGDIALPVSSLKSLLAAIEMDDQQALNDATTVDPTSVEWRKPFAMAGIKIDEATFDSLAAAILPEASNRGHFWLVRPNEQEGQPKRRSTSSWCVSCKE